MLDLGKEKVPVNCPSCNRRHSATLNDVGRGRVIRCGCGTNIQLKDSDGSVKRGVNDINRAFKKLDDTFKKLGN
jgi:hypothetical protein